VLLAAFDWGCKPWDVTGETNEIAKLRWIFRQKHFTNQGGHAWMNRWKGLRLM
jgi:hypothetical protein